MAGTVSKHVNDVNYYQLPSPRLHRSISSYYIIVKSYLFTDLLPLLDSQFRKERGEVLVAFDRLQPIVFSKMAHFTSFLPAVGSIVCALPFKVSGF